MESLVTEVCCTSLGQKTHPHACNLKTASHSSSSSSRRQPSKPSPTTALLNADKKTSPALPPLPPSRPLFPSPSKFLWFGRDKPSKSSGHIHDIPLPFNSPEETQSIDNNSATSNCTCFINDADEASTPSDALLMKTDHASTNAEDLDEVRKQLAMHMASSTPDNQVTSTESECPSDDTWISRLLRLRLLWKSSDSQPSGSKELVESALLIAAQEADKALLNVSDDCSKEGDGADVSKWSNEVSTSGGSADDADDEDGVCMLESSKQRVVHDRESMSMFLHEVSVSEVQVISRLCLLSNLAYIIPEVQSKDLLKDHHVKFVTSSLVKKEAAEAEVCTERAIVHVNKEKNKMKIIEKNQPELGNAASREVNSSDGIDAAHDKAALSYQNKPHSDAKQKADTSQDLAPQAQDVVKVHQVMPNSEEERKKKRAFKEATLKVQSTCPCDWFICDDEASSTRYLVIQGSESLASWQTNLTFDPTNFEGLLGVLVHRGVYEAAQRLYHLVEKEMVEHARKGSHARLCFTGHSLGGSLATLIAMMLVKRGVVPASAVDAVVTLGAPCVLCAGERVLQQLRLQEQQFINVVMHRDIVPRAFACDYPHHVARLLQRVNATFRDHPCLNYQNALYTPVGQMMVLQPDEAQSPCHPLLPSTAGLYLIRHPPHPVEQKQHHEVVDARQAAIEVREAQRAFFNTPHPLDVLRDLGSYGFQGAISRDHDPRSYRRAINTVLAHSLRRLRSLRRKGRRTVLSIQYTLPSPAPFFQSPSSSLPVSNSSPSSGSHRRHPLIPSRHVHMGLLFILSITSELIMSILSWA